MYQIIILYTLNLYNVICHLYFNKAGKKFLLKVKNLSVNPNRLFFNIDLSSFSKRELIEKFL